MGSMFSICDWCGDASNIESKKKGVHIEQSYVTLNYDDRETPQRYGALSERNGKIYINHDWYAEL